MFNIGFGELLVILLAAFLLLKPEDLPKMMRKLGRLVGQVKKYRNTLNREIEKMEELPEEPSGEDRGGKNS